MARRKLPVTSSAATSSSHTSKATQTLIRKFHTLLKKESAATVSNDLVTLNAVRAEIEKLGGLPAYQAMSSVGQSADRGGGTEKVLIEWLPEFLPASTKGKGVGRLPAQHRVKPSANTTVDLEPNAVKLLEVGALTHDNYEQYPWIDNTPIDLHSRHPRIKQQDFFDMLKLEPNNKASWDVISLSLVLNFVGNAHDRGKMLALAHTMLRHDGLLFLVLPSPCISNSRYLDMPRLTQILSVIGFDIVKSRMKEGGKLVHLLCRKRPRETMDEVARYRFGGEYGRKKTVREGSTRNNFVILLRASALEDENNPKSATTHTTLRAGTL